MHVNKFFLFVAILMTLLVGGLTAWSALKSNDSDPFQVSAQTAVQSGVERITPQRDVFGSALPSAPPRLPPEPAKPANNSPVLDLTSGYTSRDPYPMLVAFRESRQKGTFAASLEIRLACFDALLAISRAPNHFAQSAQETDVHLQARLNAKQEIEVRCSRFAGQDALDLGQPLPGDLYGDRYRQALLDLHRGTDREGELAAISEIFSQGMAATRTAVQTLGQSQTWRGESWRDRKDEFGTATSLAIRLATSAPSAGSADLRDLRGCYMVGPCTDFLSRSLSYFPSERRPIVEALARDMAASLRAGDVRPWQPAKATSSGG